MSKIYVTPTKSFVLIRKVGWMETLYLDQQLGGQFFKTQPLRLMAVTWLTGSRQQDLSHKDTVALTMRHPCSYIGEIDGDTRLYLASLGNSIPYPMCSLLDFQLPLKKRSAP